jgi:hypothetical protein
VCERREGGKRACIYIASWELEPTSFSLSAELKYFGGSTRKEERAE